MQKPVSRHISQLILPASTRGYQILVAQYLMVRVITVYPHGYRPDETVYYDGATHYDGNYYYSGENE